MNGKLRISCFGLSCADTQGLKLACSRLDSSNVGILGTELPSARCWSPKLLPPKLPATVASTRTMALIKR